MKARITFFILLIISAGLFYSSCSEGIFNFNDETGNVSIKFTIDPAVSESLQNVVFNLESDSGDSIRKDVEIYNYDGSQGAECYISRIDTGTWTLETTVYNESGSIAAGHNDVFELALAQTVIAEMTYYSGGGIDVKWEKPAGSELESLLDMYRFDALISAAHTAGDPVENSKYTTVLIAGGTNLYSSLSRFSIGFPDNSFFEYTTSRSTGISNIQVEISSEYLTIQRDGYYAKGNYTLTAGDPNDVETILDDYCSFGYEPATGLATLNGAYTDLGAESLTSTCYDKNDSASAGCYILYMVEAGNGTNVVQDSIGTGTLNYFSVDDPSTSADIFMGGVDDAAGTFNIVLVTVDTYINSTDLESAYAASGSPDLSPENISGWLFMYFGEQINMIGLSVEQEVF